jgi:hypothetical protein
MLMVKKKKENKTTTTTKQKKKPGGKHPNHKSNLILRNCHNTLTDRMSRAAEQQSSSTNAPI